LEQIQSTSIEKYSGFDTLRVLFHHYQIGYRNDSQRTRLILQKFRIRPAITIIVKIFILYSLSSVNCCVLSLLPHFLSKHGFLFTGDPKRGISVFNGGASDESTPNGDVNGPVLPRLAVPLSK
jgi:hypothetical protein